MSVFIPPSSLSPTSLQFPVTASWVSPGVCPDLAECWTACDAAKHWALPHSPLLSIAFRERVRKEGRVGRQAWQTEFELLVLVALEKGVRTVRWEPPRGKEQEEEWRKGMEGTVFLWVSPWSGD